LRQCLGAATRMTRYSAVYASKLSHLGDLASSAAIPLQCRRARPHNAAEFRPGAE
jgi:hypothetical protein